MTKRKKMTEIEFDRIKAMLVNDNAYGSRIRRVARRVHRSNETVRVIDLSISWGQYLRRNQKPAKVYSDEEETTTTFKSPEPQTFEDFKQRHPDMDDVKLPKYLVPTLWLMVAVGVIFFVVIGLLS